MSAIVIEHVKVSELPETWREKLAISEDVRVTVRIEPETTIREGASKDDAEDSLFGMWRDRQDLMDVPAYVRKLRAPRF